MKNASTNKQAIRFDLSLDGRGTDSRLVGKKDS